MHDINDYEPLPDERCQHIPMGERTIYFRSYITEHMMAGAFGIMMNHTFTGTGKCSEGNHA